MTRRIRRSMLLTMAGILLSVSNVHAADIEQGEQLARRWCSECHVVSSDQNQASADVPAFATVARRPNFSAQQLAFFLLEPHPKMPNFPLSRGEAADLAAYIGSLARQ